MFMKIYFFILLITKTFSAPSNYINSIHSNPIMGYVNGTWMNDIFCDSARWVTGFAVLIDCSDFGIITLRLYCSDWNGNYIQSITFSVSGSFNKGSWTSLTSCPSKGFITGYQTRGCCCPHSNNLAIFNLNMMCSTTNTLNTPVTCGDINYSWSTPAYCQAGTAVCGFKVRFQNYDTYCDNSAMHDLELKCCKICNPSAGVYLSGTSCNFCSMSCLTCSSATSCESCGGSDQLSGSTCQKLSNIYKISEEFTGTTTSDFSNNYAIGLWSGGYSFYICGDWKMFGLFGSGKTLQKSVSNMVPHYRARLKVRVYKINDWGSSEKISIKADGLSLSDNKLSNWGSNSDFYYGNVCEGSGNENTYIYDEEFPHYANSIVLIYSSNLGSSKYWGMSHMGLYVYRCNPTCKSCTGPSANQCTSCYDHATLTINNECFCDGEYFAVTQSDCTIETCTVCTPCYPGCWSCTSTAYNACTSCKTDFYFYSQQCLTYCPSSPAKFGNQTSHICEDQCAFNEYYDLNRICQKCDEICYTCFAGPLNCTSCTGTRYLENFDCKTLCSIGLFGVYSCHECLSDCEDYYFQHDVDRLCYIVCPSGYYGDVTTKKCVSSCPVGTYKDPITIRCEYCDFNCFNCSGSVKNCLACKYNYLEELTCDPPSYSHFYDSNVFTTTLDNNAINNLNFTITNSKTSNYMNLCSTKYNLLGGPLAFDGTSSISKTYTTLPDHFQGRVTFFFMKIDDWNNEKVMISIDGTLEFSLVFNSLNDTSLMKTCGEYNLTEAVRPIDIVFLHNNTASLEITISTDLPPLGNAYWGIYDYSFSLDICHDVCKTCNGPLSSHCLSCYTGLYLQDPPGPSSCEPLCPDGLYSEFSTNTCENCDKECLKCSGPTSHDCIACVEEKFLLKLNSSMKICADSCPSDYFSIGNVCTKCDVSCKTCSSGATKGCLSCDLPRYFMSSECLLSCPNNFYGDNETKSCVDVCPDGTFANKLNQICTSCFVNCKGCTSQESNQCTSCNEYYFLEENSCVSACSETHFINPQNKSCDICVDHCEICSSLETCSQCKQPYYLALPLNNSCISCSEKGELKEESMRICLRCPDQCEICDLESNCKKCLAGYFLSESEICVFQRKIKAELSTTDSPQIIQLVFTEKWPSFTEKIMDYINIDIEGVEKDSFSFDAVQGENAATVFFEFLFIEEIQEGTMLNMTINYADVPNDEFLLSQKNLGVALKAYCPPPTTYLESKKKCVEVEYITPNLQTTPSSNILTLIFTNNYGEIYSLYSKYSNITIDTLNTSSYSYKISQTNSSKDVFMITMNYTQSISNRLTMTLNLNPPDSVLHNNSNNLQLTTYKLKVALKDYYILSDQMKSALSTTTEGTNTLNQAAGNAFVANNILMGSSFGIKSLVSMDIVRFFRYFLIDYPPPVLAMYETSMPTSDLIPNVNFDEESADGSLPDIFTKYNLSIYVFNNNGNILIETMVYIGIGIAVVVFLKYFKDIKNRYFRILLLLLRVVYVWNYAVSYYLAQFMSFTLSTLLSYRFPTKSTRVGIFNYIFAIMDGVLIFFNIVASFCIIKRIRPLLHSASMFETINKKKKTSKGNLDNSNAMVSTNRQLKASMNFEAKADVSFQQDSTILSKSKLQKQKSLELVNLNEEDINNKSITENFCESPKIFKPLRTLKPVQFKKIEENDDTSYTWLKQKKKEIVLNSPEPNNFPDSPTLLKSQRKEVYLNDESVLSIHDVDINHLHKSPNKSGFANSSNMKEETATKGFSKDFIQEMNTKATSMKESKLAWLEKVKKKVKSYLATNQESVDWRRDDLKIYEIELKRLNKSFFPLHKDFKHQTKLQSYYVLLDIIRQTMFCLLVVVMYDIPFAGLILVNIINIIFIFVLIIVRPFRKKADFIQNLLNELCLLLTGFSALLLISMEKFGIEDLDFKMSLGWVMVGTNTFLILMFLIRITINFLILLSVLMKFLFKIIIRQLRRNAKITDEKEGNAQKDDKILMQQILEIQNFLR